MVPMEYKKLNFPMKIGNEDNVLKYSKALKNGEEQLLVSRTGKLFLTNGAGGYLSFISNSVYTQSEIDDKLTINTGALNQKIENLDNAVAAIRVEFGNYVLKTDFNTFKMSMENSIFDLDTKIVNLKNDTTHSNISILKKFDEDVNGNPLYQGKKLATNIETTDAEMDTDIKMIWGDTI